MIFNHACGVLQCKFFSIQITERCGHGRRDSKSHDKKVEFVSIYCLYVHIF